MTNNTANSNAILKFQLDQIVNQPETTTYRPWGIRTLKVKVCSKTRQDPLIIRPRGMRQNEAQKGIFYAHADNSDDFIVTWGGGHEQGLCAKSKDVLWLEECVPLEERDSSYIFFNVRHIGASLPDSEEPVITLEAYHEKEGRSIGAPISSLPIKLLNPADVPSLEEIIRLRTDDHKLWAISSGQYLPRYDSRWWPTAGVTYEKQDGLLPLSILRAGTQIIIRWNENNIATITDYTNTLMNTPLFVDIAFELFDFDEWSVALRVWFFWLDKRIDDVDPDREIGIIGRNEVPDSERFDFIIRRKDGRILLACTDLHWREKWFMTTDEGVPEATIGMGRKTKKELFKEKLAFWKGIYSKIRARLHKEREPYNNPLPYIRRKAAAEAKKRIRGKGIGAHIPMLHNVIMPKEGEHIYTSSDVRQG